MISQDGMYHDECGDADIAVVFLHYFGSSGGAWQPLASALGSGVRCIMPHLRGFGESGYRGLGFSVEHYANDISRLVRTLRLERFVLAGHSMGGKIALALAARRPEGLQSVVLFAPSPPTPEPMSDDARDELRQMFRDREKISAHLRQLCAQPLPEHILHRECSQHLMASAAAWHAWIDCGSREDISENMPAIQAPVLVIGGEKDHGITPGLLQQEVVDRLPQAQLEILADTGHLLPLERPAQVASLLHNWFRAAGQMHGAVRNAM